VNSLLAQGREKLLRERNGREMPFVDRTLYTSLNGMFITSFLKAYRVLGDPGLRAFALASLDRILLERSVDGALQHCEGVPAVLDDHVYLVEALVAAYEATGDRARLDLAVTFMDRCVALFGDPAGGFFDTAAEVLGTRLKRIEDIPHPSANAVAVMLLVKLYHLAGREPHRAAAERSLRIFSTAVREMSIHAGTYFCGLDAWFATLKLTVEAGPDSGLARAAMRLAGPHTVLLYGVDRGRIIPCVNETCYEPVTNAVDLLRYATSP